MTSKKPSLRGLGAGLVALGLFLGILVPALIRVNFALSDTGKGIVLVLTVAGLLVYCGGLGLLARCKGHSVFWGLTGLFCWIGGIAVAVLKPKPPTLPRA